jgi:hypothetical protein
LKTGPRVHYYGRPSTAPCLMPDNGAWPNGGQRWDSRTDEVSRATHDLEALWTAPPFRIHYAESSRVSDADSNSQRHLDWSLEPPSVNETYIDPQAAGYRSHQPDSDAMMPGPSYPLDHMHTGTTPAAADQIHVAPNVSSRSGCCAAHLPRARM